MLHYTAHCVIHMTAGSGMCRRRTHGGAARAHRAAPAARDVVELLQHLLRGHGGYALWDVCQVVVPGAPNSCQRTA